MSDTVKSSRKLIQDEFTALQVSRQRKWQLRKRATEQEIRERIAAQSKLVEDREKYGRISGEEWRLAMRAIAELKWVLGE